MKYIMDIVLTNDQSSALEKIILFLTDKEKYIHVLCGSAGTGKSFLVRQIISSFQKQFNICCITPTHKSKEVLMKMLLSFKNETYKVDLCTIASILGKLKEHSYIGTKTFSNGNDEKLTKYNFFIIDEVSMVSDDDLNIITNYVKTCKKKLLCVGDQYQIPSPSQRFVRSKINGTHCAYKADSMAFFMEDCNISYLWEIVRQESESYIIKVATRLRDNIMKEVVINEIETLNMSDMLDKFSEYVKIYPTTTKCICYTNVNVYDINILIRNKIYQHNKTIDKFYQGECVMAYNTLGYPLKYIENGKEYVIEKCVYNSYYMIKHYHDLCGHLVKLADVNKILFFIEVNNPYNDDFMRELIRLANIVNSKNSSKQTFINYNNLRNEVIFLEDIYVYEDKFYGKYEFKKQHPLLFTKTKDIINTCLNGKTLINNMISAKMMMLYENIINDRISDDKIISENETFADKFMIIEKDLDYSYAITAHKSQGSTYDVVFVYDKDFDKLIDKYNHRLKCMEFSVKEKNQLRYVSYTRARKELYFFNRDNLSEDTQSPDYVDDDITSL